MRAIEWETKGVSRTQASPTAVTRDVTRDWPSGGADPSRKDAVAPMPGKIVPDSPGPEGLACEGGALVPN